MKAGQETKMLRGAIWACVIPVGIGLILLVIALFSLRSPAVPSGALYMNSRDFLAFLPIAACFIFGAPLSAWLACRSLRKINSINKISLWRSSALRGVLSASLIHVVSALLYIISVSVIILGDNYVSFSKRDQAYNPLPDLFIGSAIINLVLWVIITLPLALICATIFWRVTKFPQDTSVF